MRISPTLVALLPLASAFVLHDADVFEKIEKTGRRVIGNGNNVFDNVEKTGRGALRKGQSVLEHAEKTGREALDRGQTILEESKTALDEALEKAMDGAKTLGDDVYGKIYRAGCDVDAWLQGSSIEEEDHDHPHHPPHDKPPHHGPPHDGPPHHGPPRDGPPHHGPPHDGPPHHGPPRDGPPHHGPPHDGPPHHGPPRDGPPHHGPPRHGPPHHGPSNLTVYQMIAKSNYTTRLAKLLDDYPDLIKTLNSTKASYTVFAPVDSAFEKIPHHGHKPSKDDIEKVLLYHVVPDLYPADRVLRSYTLPTLYEPSDPNLLGHPQRLTVRLTLKGPTINFYSKLIALNIRGSNGIIHGIDSLLIPPPNVATIIDILPGEFSTLELGLGKTDLWEKLNSTEFKHLGGTFFAPSNFAFKKLGPRINAFLFSKGGEKYLKALLEYHMVVDLTLYSDAFFDGTKVDKDTSAARPPYYHLDLPTVLGGKFLAVDIMRYGPFVSIRINGFSRVTVHDGVASDGVIQIVSDVLIPPKKPGPGSEKANAFWQGEEMSVDEFKERLDPYVGENIEL